MLPGEIAENETFNLDAEKIFTIMLKNVVDNILTGLRQRFKSMETTAQDFTFLNPTSIYSWSIGDLKRHGIDLCIKYENYLDKIEFISELGSFKEHLYVLDKRLKNASSFEMLNFIYKNGL